MSMTIDYYLSLNSPWSFLGGARLHALAARYGVSVNVCPIDASQVFPLSGGVPVTKRAPQRQAYRLLELDRWRKFLDIPLILQPSNFPNAEAEAARLVAAAGLLGLDALALANAFGHALWVEDKAFAEADVRADVMAGLSFDVAALEARAVQAEVTDTLAQFTAQAIERQVFGMPTYVFQGEMFWGQDRVDFLQRALAAAA
jgi:2-hydroxychromene-2-carboxylate isomerase